MAVSYTHLRGFPAGAAGAGVGVCQGADSWFDLTDHDGRGETACAARYPHPPVRVRCGYGRGGPVSYTHLAEEVRAALEKSGFTILSHEKSDDWSAFAAKK